MTRQEAFKFLANTKVFVEDKSKEIQKKAFEFGYIWPGVGKEIRTIEAPFLFFSRRGTIYWENNRINFYSAPETLITADQILKIIIDDDEFKPYDQVLVRNNKFDTWTATLYSHKIPKNELYAGQYVCCGKEYAQCIPYKGNEELIGTTKEPE